MSLPKIVYLKAVMLVALLHLSGCSNIHPEVSALRADTKTVDGSGDSSVDGAATSVTVTAQSKTVWNKLLINLGVDFTAVNICIGKTIFGRLGVAACGLASRAHRDIGSVTERPRSLVNNDHDGFGSQGGTDPLNNLNPANTITLADTSGIVTCGNTQATVAARIANCNYSWDGATLGNTGHGKWNLVTKVNSKEVWQDERTGMLWGDNMGTNNWCQAVGNTENTGDDIGGWTVDCTPNAGIGLQPATPVSMCAEADGFDSSGYDDQKGGMRLVATGSSPSVAWRLPSRDDFLQAYVNGAGYVMSVFRDGNNYWSSSVYSVYRNWRVGLLR